MSAPAPLRIVVVDDHPVVRDGLRGMLDGQTDLAVVGEAADGLEAVTVVARERPDVVLMDLRMPGMDGVAATSKLHAADPQAKVLILTTYNEDHDIVLAIEAGARGALLKDAPREELFRAVEAAARGQAVLSPTVATRLMGQMRQPASEPLSQRELEVLELIARGSTNREAAAQLFISEATVKTHLLHVYAKLGVNDRAAAVATAFDRGFLTPRS